MTSLVSGYDLPPSVLINGKRVGSGVSKYDDEVNERRERDLIRLLDSSRNERGELFLSDILRALEDFHSGRGTYAHVDDDDEKDDCCMMSPSKSTSTSTPSPFSAAN